MVSSCYSELVMILAEMLMMVMMIQYEVSIAIVGLKDCDQTSIIHSLILTISSTSCCWSNWPDRECGRPWATSLLSTLENQLAPPIYTTTTTIINNNDIIIIIIIIMITVDVCRV